VKLVILEFSCILDLIGSKDSRFSKPVLILSLETVSGTFLLAFAVHLAIEEVAPKVLVLVFDDDAKAVGQIVVEVTKKGVLIEVEFAVLALLVVLIEEASKDGAGGVFDFP
jgi:hypothetical protein